MNREKTVVLGSLYGAVLWFEYAALNCFWSGDCLPFNPVTRLLIDSWVLQLLLTGGAMMVLMGAASKQWAFMKTFWVSAGFMIILGFVTAQMSVSLRTSLLGQVANLIILSTIWIAYVTRRAEWKWSRTGLQLVKPQR